jgi:hypothetical protein
VTVFCITVKIWKVVNYNLKSVLHYLLNFYIPSLILWGFPFRKRLFHALTVFLFSRNPDVLDWMGKYLMFLGWGHKLKCLLFSHIRRLCLSVTTRSFLFILYLLLFKLTTSLPNKNSLTPPAFVVLVFTSLCNRSSMLLPEYKHCFWQIKVHVIS